MQFYIILDHYYYHICEQKVGKTRTDNKLYTRIAIRSGKSYSVSFDALYVDFYVSLGGAVQLAKFNCNLLLHDVTVIMQALTKDPSNNSHMPVCSSKALLLAAVVSLARTSC